jgi:endo-1,4-beta-xylanase
MVPVTLTVDATDDLSTPVSRIVSVTCSENPRRGNLMVDYQITGPLSVNLRAIRLGQGNGRVYIIVVESTDSAGQTARAQVQVTVPHSRARPEMPRRPVQLTVPRSRAYHETSRLH